MNRSSITLRKIEFANISLRTALLVLLPLSTGHAALITWTNASGGAWTSASNWNPNQVPGSADAAVIGIPVSVTISGSSSLASLTVSNTATLLCLGSNTTSQVNTQWAGVGVTITAGSISVAAGAAISADGQGYTGGGNSASGNGPGGGTYLHCANSGGGSYGGGGGINAGPAYGSPLAPVDLGSGGGGQDCGSAGPGGNGGGAIRLNVAGTLQLDGSISASGSGPGAGNAGAGSGGSVYAMVGTLAGTGNFRADGGPGGGSGGGGGGGGRIAVYYSSAVGYAGFTNSTASNGGNGGAQDGSVAFFDTSVSNLALSVFRGQALLQNPTNHYSAVNINGGSLLLGTSNYLHVDTALSMQSGANLTLGGASTLQVDGALSMASNGTVICQGANTSSQTGGVGVAISAGSLTVAAGAAISAGGQGYTGGGNTASGNGTGGGVFQHCNNSGGGSYGGGGAINSGPTYGFPLAPVDLGSGGGGQDCGSAGPGGNGGGAIRLIVAGKLQLDGSISANGSGPGAGNAGAGSGGSVYATVGTLAGAGTFHADGGPGSSQGGGGGGGGRIAVYYATASGYTTFAACSANAGNGGNGSPQNGTVVFLDTSVASSSMHIYQQLLFGQQSALHFGAVMLHTNATLTLGGGSALQVDGSLTVSSNGTLFCQGLNTTAQVSNQWAGVGVSINAGSLSVAAGAAISADGQGYAGGGNSASGNGPGGGAYLHCANSGGGSYGGGGAINAGPTYGSPLAPVDLGSGGGGQDCGSAGPGGNGGGAIRLNVAGTLQLDGSISASGSGPGAGNAGAGSGGSVYATVGALAGAGTFHADGGPGGSQGGGGGGGGRIAVYYAAAVGYTGFTNSTSGGSNGGQDGSAVFFDTSALNQTLSVFRNQTLLPNPTSHFTAVNINGGNLLLGASNVLHVDTALAMQGGGKLTLGGAGTLQVDGALTVLSNATLICQGANIGAPVSNQWVGIGVDIVAASVTVAAGGAISADGQGYAGGTAAGPASGNGPGGGTARHCGNSGGGGFGAYGGQGGGSPYGSPTAPTDLGSGGGGQDCGSSGPGGNGGGAIRLIVAGTLQLDGTISSGGAGTGAGNAGAGSGGSIYATVGTLAGAGTFHADGGPGPSGGGGGGGGGRIAIYYAASGYTGFAACSANAGANGQGAQNGTVAFFDTSIANLGLHVYQQLLFIPQSPLHYGSVTVHTNATVTLPGGSTLQVDGSLSMGSSALLLCPGSNTTAQVSSQWAGVGVIINASNITVAAGAAISADGQGYAGGGNTTSGSGPGAGVFQHCANSGGGSYGGGGAINAGSTYGAPLAPDDLGSGGGGQDCGSSGPGGNGGGAIRLNVAGTLQLDGSISASGSSAGAANAGAGSGGSVYALVGSLAGAGTFRADGGLGGSQGGGGGGGGGGRIAVYYASTSGYTGFRTCSAANGNGAQYGTVAFFDTSVPSDGVHVYQQLLFSQQSVLHFGAMTLHTNAALTLGGGSIMQVDGSLTVSSNGTVFCQGLNTTAQVSNQWAGVGVTINAGNLTVATGAAISANGQGYTGGGNSASGNGPGGGAYLHCNNSGGGSYGGGGAISAGPIYGSASAPVDLGSGGGGQDCGSAGPGGNGGGAIRLIVSGAMQVDGSVSASGYGSSAANAGAGAGGSIYGVVGSLAGAGNFQASGGPGGSGGGAGGGGRIAIYFCGASTFNTNNITASAGSGGNGVAQAGTVVISSLPAACPLQITQPSNLAVGVGATASFTVVATGGGPVSYQWQFNGTNLTDTGRISGSQSGILTITNVSLADMGSYQVSVANPVETLASDIATLTVLTVPGILTQPTNLTVQCGSNASFTVSASSQTPLSYQWYASGAGAISGATGASLVLSNVSLALSNDAYSVVLANLSGSVTSHMAVLAVVDRIPPVITLNGSATITIIQSNSFTDPGATAYDFCAGGAVPITTNNPVNTGLAGTYTITYIATENGNSATNSRTVQVNPASCAMPPSGLAAWWPGSGNANDVIGGNNGALTGAATFASGEVGQGFNFPGGTTGGVFVAASPSLNVGAGNGLTIDLWINPSDTTPEKPLAEWNNLSSINGDGVQLWISVVCCGGVAGDIYANLIDTAGTGHTFQSASVITSNEFQHVALTYDKSSGVAVLYRNGTAVAQQTLGSFTPQTAWNLYLGQRPNPAGGAVAAYAGLMDEVDIFNRALSQTEILGIYSAGSAGKCLPTNCAPVVTVLGSTNATVECHTTFVDPGATATDNCAIISATTNGSVNANAVGTYMLSYVAIDSGGISATNTRTVRVVDTTPPVVTLNGSATITNECHSSFADPGATANDACAGARPVTTFGSVNVNAVGAYTLSYVATDLSGNSATNTRTVQVVDTTPPVITVLGANPLTVLLNSTFTDPGATASDTCAGSRPVTTNGTVDVTTIGSYTIMYVASDLSGNFATNSRMVNVTTNQAPIIISQPSGLTTNATATVSFSVEAVGGSLTYQWLKNGTNLSDTANVSGSATSTLTLSNVLRADGASYSVLVSNGLGTTNSDTAVLTVIDPFILEQPVDAVVLAGRTTNFTVVAVGTPTLRYQWYSVLAGHSHKLTGQTNATLTLGPATTRLTGGYFVVVTNQLPLPNAVTSRVARLTVYVQPSIAILTPKAGQTFFTNFVLATGTAKNNVGVGSVWYQLNNGPWTQASGTTAWRANLTGLASGTNVLRAYALDTGGDASATASVTFYYDAFLAQAGIYNGLFYDTTNGVQQPSSGYFSLKLQNNGAYSAYLLIGSNKTSLSGSFDLSGFSSSSAGALSATMYLDLTGGDNLTGTVSTTDWQSALWADRLVWSSRTNKATTYQGTYTLIIFGADDVEALPAGDSYAYSISIDAGGNVNLKQGVLADGHGGIFSQSTTLSKDGRWPFYAPAYGGSGSVWSWITNQAGTNLIGDVSWNKPATASDQYYPGGFTNLFAAQGSSYRPSIMLPTGMAAMVVFSGGNLPGPVTNFVTFSGNDKIMATNHLQLNIARPLGKFDGNVTFPGSTNAVPIHGALLQDLNEIFGFFLGTDQSGSVSVTPQ
ncbi:MAG: hypothetical protein C5B50_23020 [Verrucomicrobia bacterium]|nr:MAG: hypothetical protein C5B50_23020 [Verrucomicrobiota bacterium]